MIVETCRQYQKDKQCIVDASLLNWESDAPVGMIKENK